MRVLIWANGEPPSEVRAQALAAGHDLVIATDGAARTAFRLGLTPDLICGDFDSLDVDRARHDFPDAEFLPTPDQDFADLEKALRLARERGATAVTFIGAGGGRLDHTLTTIALLVRYHRDVDLTLAEDHGTLKAVSGIQDEPGRLRLETSAGDTVSLITFHENNQVSLSGVKWPLENARLPVGTRGVSNIAQGAFVELEVREGVILIWHGLVGLAGDG